jgi:hypothetical protein
MENLVAKTKTYKVLFRKEGMNLAKTIYAQSLSDVLEIFKKDEVVKVLCLDALDEEEENEDDIQDQ